MAEHVEPIASRYRMHAKGARLAELHALTGSWDEFEALVRDEPAIAREIMGWVIPVDDPERAAYARAKDFAASALWNKEG